MVDWAGKPAILGSMTDIPEPRDAVHSLLQNEELYCRLVETSPDPIVMYDLTGNFISVNARTAQMYGVSSIEEFMSSVKNFAELLNDQDRARAVENLKNSLETGFSSSNEYDVYRKDRSVIKVDINSSVVYGPDGKPQAVMSIVRDITGRKYAETLLAIQHEMAKCLSMARDLKTGMKQVLEIALQIAGIDCGGVYIMKHDSKGNSAAGSIELLAHAGLSQEFVDEVSLYGAGDPKTRAIAKGEPLYSTYGELASSLALNEPAVAAYGIRALAVVPVKFEGSVMGAIMVGSLSMDETPTLARQVLEGMAAQIGGMIARANVEEALRRSEERFRGYFNLSLIGVAVISPEGNWIEVNDKICSIFGYTGDELKATSWMTLTPEEDLRDELRLYKEFIAGTRSNATFGKRYIRKDGSLISTEISLHCVRSFDGTPDHLVAVIQDITDRKKSEELLIQALKMESIGRLAGGVAHDLNNMLTPVIGYSDILLSDIHPDDPRHRSITLIQKAAESAKNLTHQLLAFSRRQVLEMKLVDLNKIISGFEKILMRTIRENIEIRVRFGTSLGFVSADIGQVEQILMNLAVNAQDAMPDGGILTILTDEVIVDESYPAIHGEIRPGRYVLLEVCDTGVGIDPQIRENIFEPFFTTKGRGMGTGLGLATIYGIVKQHGGFINVYSEKGNGTCFKIYLPSEDCSLLPVEEAVKEPQEIQGEETVLIAEDNEMVRNLASEILKRSGYTVITVDNAGECLNAVSQSGRHVDLLLTDVIMPDMNGKDLYAALHAKYPHVRVVYMSGYTEDVIAHHGVLDKGMDFIQKPFSARNLMEKIREVLDRNNLAEMAALAD